MLNSPLSPPPLAWQIKALLVGGVTELVAYSLGKAKDQVSRDDILEAITVSMKDINDYLDEHGLPYESIPHAKVNDRGEFYVDSGDGNYFLEEGGVVKYVEIERGHRFKEIVYDPWEQARPVLVQFLLKQHNPQWLVEKIISC